MPRFLLVSSLHGISRYQEESGTFMDVFVPLGSGACTIHAVSSTDQTGTSTSSVG